jgi:hypothetical protein
MKRTTIAAFTLAVMSASTWAFAQAVEMAGPCDRIRNQLEELIKKPEIADADAIKQALGLDILISCDAEKGRIICYQCVDKDENLNTLQILQDQQAKKLTFLGFGCRCRDEK